MPPVSTPGLDANSNLSVSWMSVPHQRSPCVKGAGAVGDWGIALDFTPRPITFSTSIHNPSVTASPCHLPCVKGGFGLCVYPTDR